MEEGIYQLISMEAREGGKGRRELHPYIALVSEGTATLLYPVMEQKDGLYKPRDTELFYKVNQPTHDMVGEDLCRTGVADACSRIEKVAGLEMLAGYRLQPIAEAPLIAEEQSIV